MKAELRDNPILGGQEREVKQAMGFTESGQWGEGKPGIALYLLQLGYIKISFIQILSLSQKPYRVNSRLLYFLFY